MYRYVEGQLKLYSFSIVWVVSAPNPCVYGSAVTYIYPHIYAKKKNTKFKTFLSTLRIMDSLNIILFLIIYDRNAHRRKKILHKVLLTVYS